MAAVRFLVRSGDALPSANTATSVPLTLILAGCPAGPAVVEYFTALLARASRATSQEDVNLRVPTGLNRSPQSAGSATTWTLAVSIAFSSIGFAALVRAVNSGK